MSELNLPIALPAQQVDEADIAIATKTGDYLPRLGVTTSTSTLVQKGLLNQGVISLIWDDKKYKDLGKTLDMLVIAWHPKAIDMRDTVIAVYNRNNPMFAEIMERSKGTNSKCAYGPEFLVYIPSENQFATFHMGSISARKESGTLLQMMQQGSEFKPVAATLKPHFIEGRTNNWWAPSIQECNTPLPRMPDAEPLQEEFDKFRNAKDSVIETVKEGVAGGRAR